VQSSVRRVFAPGNGSQTVTKVVVVVVVGVLVVIRFSKYLNFFISQAIVIKLRILIGDNIPDFSTESDL